MGKKICGAKTRSGKPCQGKAMANGRCRMHGGKSTGPKNTEAMRGNKRAVKHGRYESIFLDALSEDEQEIIAQASTDPLKVLDDQIRLEQLRLRRMLKRIEKLNDSRFTIVETTETITASGDKEAGDAATEKKLTAKKVSADTQIMNIEAAITAQQGLLARLVDQKQRMTKEAGTGGEGVSIVLNLAGKAGGNAD